MVRVFRLWYMWVAPQYLCSSMLDAVVADVAYQHTNSNLLKLPACNKISVIKLNKVSENGWFRMTFWWFGGSHVDYANCLTLCISLQVGSLSTRFSLLLPNPCHRIMFLGSEYHESPFGPTIRTQEEHWTLHQTITGSKILRPYLQRHYTWTNVFNFARRSQL